MNAIKDALESGYLDDPQILLSQPRIIALRQGWAKEWDAEDGNAVADLPKTIKENIAYLHLSFLKSLIRHGRLILYRSMASEGFSDAVPGPGDTTDLGQHWTYSRYPDLGSAMFAAEPYDITFKAEVKQDQVDWSETLTDHLGRYDGEKQIFVEGPVRIVATIPFSKYYSRHLPTISEFEKWLRTNLAQKR